MKRADSDSEYLALGAAELARCVARNEVTPLELLDLHIQRIETVNPKLNAMVCPRFEAARAEARDATERLAHTRHPGELPPLFGVPCTIKEFFAFEGMPWTGGILARKDRLAERDSTIVQRLKGAGAIIMGSTNVPEGGLWMETHNLIYGRTNNPWDLRHSPGGSSGGEGALVAAGASPFGIGSDIGGSIRIPAAFCGVPGHKPSGRMVPNTGHFPPALGDAGAFLCCGPLARKVEDLALVTRVIAGPDGEDTLCQDMPMGQLDAVRMDEVVVFPVEGNGRVWVWKEMRRAIQDSADALAERGARVEYRDFPRLKYAFETWSSMLSDATNTHYGMVLGEGQAIPIWRELMALPFGRSRHSYPALILAALDELTGHMKGTIQRFVEVGLELRTELEDALGPMGVLLHPPYTRPAPRHNRPWLTPLDASCTAIFNVMEFPATHVPVARSERGLPIGVQVVGSRGRDQLTLAVAAALEADLGGWQRADPPG